MKSAIALLAVIALGSCTPQQPAGTDRAGPEATATIEEGAEPQSPDDATTPSERLESGAKEFARGVEEGAREAAREARGEEKEPEGQQ